MSTFLAAMPVHKKIHHSLKNKKNALELLFRRLLSSNPLLPFSLFLLVIGVTAGLALTMNSTELRQQAAYAGCPAGTTQIVGGVNDGGCRCPSGAIIDPGPNTCENIPSPTKIATLPTTVPSNTPFCLRDGQTVGYGGVCCSGKSYQSGNNVICGNQATSITPTPTTNGTGGVIRYSCVNSACVQASTGEFLTVSECSESCRPSPTTTQIRKQFGESCTADNQCITNYCENLSGKCLYQSFCPEACSNGCYQTDGNRDGKLDCRPYCSLACQFGCSAESSTGGICKGCPKSSCVNGKWCGSDERMTTLNCPAGLSSCDHYETGTCYENSPTPTVAKPRYSCVNSTCVVASQGEYLTVSECSEQCKATSTLFTRISGQSCNKNTDCASNYCNPTNNTCTEQPMCSNSCSKGCYSIDGNGDGQLDCRPYCKSECSYGCVYETTGGGVCIPSGQLSLPENQSCDPNAVSTALKCSVGTTCIKVSASEGYICKRDNAQIFCPSSCLNGCILGSGINGATPICKPYCERSQCLEDCTVLTSVGGICKRKTLFSCSSGGQCVQAPGGEYTSLGECSQECKRTDVCAPEKSACDNSKSNDGCCSGLSCGISGLCERSLVCNRSQCPDGCSSYVDSLGRTNLKCNDYCRSTCNLNCSIANEFGGICGNSKNKPYCPVDTSGKVIFKDLNGNIVCSDDQFEGAIECWGQAEEPIQKGLISLAPVLFCKPSNSLTTTDPVPDNCHIETAENGIEHLSIGTSVKRGKFCYKCEKNSSYWLSPGLCTVTPGDVDKPSEAISLAAELEKLYGINIEITDNNIPLQKVKDLELALKLMPRSLLINDDGEIINIILSREKYFYEMYSAAYGVEVPFLTVLGGLASEQGLIVNIDVNCNGDPLNLYCLNNADTISVIIHETVHDNQDQTVTSKFCGDNNSCTMQEAYNAAAAADGLILYTEDNPDPLNAENYHSLDHESLAFDCTDYVLHPEKLANKPNITQVCQDILEGNTYTRVTNADGSVTIVKTSP